MVAIAQSDQFQIFMRKIGYSVGLENTFARLLDLANVYAAHRQITLADWEQLVHEKWGLNTFNIEDVFHALNIIHRMREGVNVLPTLDMLGILRLEYNHDSEFEAAAKYIFALAILEFDGEIFLNCMLAEFNTELIGQYLTRMIKYKREKLFSIYKVPAFQHQIAQVVNIERQASNRGSAGGGKTLSDQRRHEPLQKRTEPLAARPPTEIGISPDYYRKHPPKRKEWARTLGLVNADGTLTVEGRRFLNAFERAGCRIPSGEFVLWPFSHEISRLRLNPAMFEKRSIEYWDLVSTTAVGLGVVALDRELTGADQASAISRLRRHADHFRSLNTPKSLLRREFPLTIAYATFAASCLAEAKPLPSLPIVLDAERRKGSGPLEIRSSRNSIATLVFRS